MNWDAIGAVGEILGALAVVATLIYLSRQIRQEGKSTIAESTNAWLADYNSLIIDLTRDAEIADLLRRGLDDFETLPGEDQMRLHIWLIAHTLNAQNVYVQLSDEIIHRDIAENVLDFSAAMLKMKGGNYWWTTAKSILRKDFAGEIDRRMEFSPPVTDFWPWFSKQMDKNISSSKAPSHIALNSDA